MNHKELVFIIVIMLSILGNCLTATALQSSTRASKTQTSATTASASYWPPRIKNENFNWILPAPSPFRKLSAAASLQRATGLSESPSRIERKLYHLTLHATPATATNEMVLHNIDINPYAQSLNAELEIAFATVASYANSNKNNNNINNHNNILNNNNSNNGIKQPVAAANNLNVDQSPTGADFSDAAFEAFDWHRYFAMSVDNDDRSIFEQHQQQQDVQQKQQFRLEPTADAVYQAKRNKVITFH